MAGVDDANRHLRFREPFTDAHLPELPEDVVFLVKDLAKLIVGKGSVTDLRERARVLYDKYEIDTYADRRETPRWYNIPDQGPEKPRVPQKGDRLLFDDDCGDTWPAVLLKRNTGKLLLGVSAMKYFTVWVPEQVEERKMWGFIEDEKE